MATKNVLPQLSSGVKPIKRRTAAEKFKNNTSRQRKWVCACTTHIIDEETGKERPGPYIIRLAGTGALIRCDYCEHMFVLEDLAAKRRLYRGCVHCPKPEAHDHGLIEQDEEDE